MRNQATVSLWGRPLTAPWWCSAAAALPGESSLSHTSGCSRVSVMLKSPTLLPRRRFVEHSTSGLCVHLTAVCCACRRPTLQQAAALPGAVQAASPELQHKPAQQPQHKRKRAPDVSPSFGDNCKQHKARCGLPALP